VLRDQKILVTGPAGQIAFPMAAYLAADNEVWGIARFSESGSRERVEALGVTTRVVDLAAGEFGDLPDDFTHVLHLATFQTAGLDYDYALAVNAEGTGLLAAHCRKAKAMLVTSTFSVYKPRSDPYHLFVETDALGDANQPHSPTYSISKIGQEAVARAAARMLGLPVTIARVNASYGPNGGLPAYHLDWMLAGHPITLRAPGPTPYSPIAQDDMNAQIEPLLAAASIPATIVNWAGDEVVSPEEWCEHLADVTGASPAYTYADYPGSIRGSASDNTKRRTLTGPCAVGWRDGMRAMFTARYPDGIVAGAMPAGAERLLSAVRRDDQE
jgi:nucleoside-diphosphate-sugar epimerase